MQMHILYKFLDINNLILKLFQSIDKQQSIHILKHPPFFSSNYRGFLICGRIESNKAAME